MSASGDDDFSTGASLSISVEQRSLRAARQEIERELADIPIGIDATVTGGGRGAVGNRSPEPANIDLARRQLGHLEALEELAIERNRFLDDGGGGGGGGGGLLPIAGGAALGSRLAGGSPVVSQLLGIFGTPPFFPGAFGRGATGPPGQLGPGDPNDPLGQAIADAISGLTGVEQVERGESRVPELALPEEFSTQLKAPPEFPKIDLTPPSWLRSLAEGLGIDININTENTITVDESLQRSEVNRFEQAQQRLSDEQQREAESIARSEVQRFQQRLERELGENIGN